MELKESVTLSLSKGYKQTELGLIPIDWEVKKLGDVIKVIGGGAFKSWDSSQSGVKWLKIANVGINKAVWDDENYLPIELIKDNEKFLLKEGDYVIALTRPILDRKLKIAKLGHTDIPALLNQRVGKIETESTNNIDYAYYLFQKFETINGLLQSMAGTDPPNLSNKGIYNIDCAVPPNKDEQTLIATALSDADALKSSLEKLIAKKRNIKQGAMQKLLQPKEGWEVKKLGEVCEIYRGGSPRPIESYLTLRPDGINWIKIGDVRKNAKYIESTEEKIISEGLSRSRFVNKGDFILSNSMSFGRPYIMKINGCIHDGWLVIQNYQNHFDRDFLYYVLGSEAILQQYKSMASGSSVLNLNKEIVKSVIINCPKSVEEQACIATILFDMDAEITALETKLEKYKKVKLGMMQNLLTGKIRLV